MSVFNIRTPYLWALTYNKGVKINQLSNKENKLLSQEEATIPTSLCNMDHNMFTKTLWHIDIWQILYSNGENQLLTKYSETIFLAFLLPKQSTNGEMTTSKGWKKNPLSECRAPHCRVTYQLYAYVWHGEKGLDFQFIFHFPLFGDRSWCRKKGKTETRGLQKKAEGI